MMLCGDGVIELVSLGKVRRKGLQVAVVNRSEERHTAQDGKPDTDTVRSSFPAAHSHWFITFLFQVYTPPEYACQLVIHH